MLFHYRIRQYFLYRPATDMRKGIDSLSGLVRTEFHQDPLLSDLFIFINRRRNQLKMLHWQGDGFAVFYKRLERGTYEIPPIETGASQMEITSEQLLFILQGVVLKSVKKKLRYTHHFVDKTSVKSMVLVDI